jgi:hypothetical protein
MITHYPISIPAHRLGPNITVQSYCDRLFLGITACGKAVPDADLLRDDLVNACRDLWAELLPTNISELNAPRGVREIVSSAPEQAFRHVSAQDPAHQKVV